LCSRQLTRYGIHSEKWQAGSWPLFNSSLCAYLFHWWRTVSRPFQRAAWLASETRRPHKAFPLSLSLEFYSSPFPFFVRIPPAAVATSYRLLPPSCSSTTHTIAGAHAPGITGKDERREVRRYLGERRGENGARRGGSRTRWSEAR